jgi:hypothetical protein
LTNREVVAFGTLVFYQTRSKWPTILCGGRHFLPVAFIHNGRRVRYMKTITVAAFNSPADAEPLKDRLVAAGIPAEIHKEPKPDETQDYSRASAGVHIEVPRIQFEAALEIVYDWNTGQEIEASLTARTQPVPRVEANPSAASKPANPL